MPELDAEARSIFLALVDRPQDEWPTALMQLCADRSDLRARVERLLADHVSLGAVSQGRVEKTRSVIVDAEAPGAVIAGEYKLLEPLGEGGFGVVYLAEQTTPVRRKVAIKILKAGMDTRQVIARFEAERQALAIMDHPNIARVFDGGVTGAGRPFFAMEYVKGVPITEFCDLHKLTPHQRLELFVDVCKAVQHAHQKGIIHRDVKPSNVLVSRHDTTPVVKVIDFGVAKAVGTALTDKTFFTAVSQMIGTPLYMSPEQAGMSDLDVDTRTDIYSLGVLLYELLTGTTPFSKERFKKAAYDEIRRIIREEDPPKPSTRVSESTETLPSVAANRGVEPRKLGGLMRGELDWIVMKALEKDRNRRYETANGFAADVLRYLAGEAVLAVPPSASYRLRKFVRRNRTGLVAASTLMVLLTIGVIGLAVSNRLIARETQRVQNEKERGDRHLERVRTVLQTYLANTSQDRRLKSAGLHDLRKALLVSMVGILEEFANTEGSDVSIRKSRGWALFHLGNLWGEVGNDEKSLVCLGQAREIWRGLMEEFPDDDENLREFTNCESNRGVRLTGLHRFEEAVAAFNEAIRIRKRQAERFPLDADYQCGLGGAYHGMALLEQKKGNKEEAVRLLERAIVHQEAAVRADPKSREARSFLANHHGVLGVVLTDLRKTEGADAALTRSRLLFEKLSADFPGDPEFRSGIASVWNNLGNLYGNDRASEALQAYRKAAELTDRLAAEFPGVSDFRAKLAGMYQNIGLLLQVLNQNEEANSAFDAGLGLREQLVKEHTEDIDLAMDLAASLVRRGCQDADAGRFGPAEKTLARARAVLEPLNAPERKIRGARGLLFRAYGARADCLLRLGRYAEAIPSFDRAIEFDDGENRSYFRVERALALAYLKEHEKAAAEAAAVCSEKDLPAFLIQDASAVYAICSTAVHTDQKRAEAYAVTAVALLRRAFEKNYKAIASEVGQNKYLDAIRNRADFKKLIAEWEAKQGK